MSSPRYCISRQTHGFLWPKLRASCRVSAVANVANNAEHHARCRVVKLMYIMDSVVMEYLEVLPEICSN